MAAELEMRNGVANIFYAGKTPWHREGVKIQGDEQHDFAGLMARHFDYPLEKLPYIVPQDPTVEPDKLIYVQGKGAYYVWRPDTKKVLSPVGSSYEIVTNTQAFEVLKPLIESRVAAIETGGGYFAKERMPGYWCDGTWKSSDEMFRRCSRKMAVCYPTQRSSPITTAAAV